MAINSDVQWQLDLRERLVEYMGGSGIDPTSATCSYIARCDDGDPYDPYRVLPPDCVAEFVRKDIDVARSLLDKKSCLVHLDMEYVNFDDPLAAYRDPVRAFSLQEPVVAEIKNVLSEYGIKPLHMLTGQGHHLVWRIRKDNSVGSRIKELTPENGRLRQRGAFTPRFFEIEKPSEEDYEIFAGLGLLMEFVAHRVLREAVSQTEIPIGLTAVSVGPSRFGRREMISLDLSEYGDPLHTRTIRMPFTRYRKQRKWGYQEPWPEFRMLPVDGLDVSQVLELREDSGAVSEFCHGIKVGIPEAEEAMESLVDDYLDSDLRKFHYSYFSVAPDSPETWDQTYRRTPVGSLPPCGRFVLENPNDWLLKPAGMQLALRCLMSQGWHPRHVAGLFWSIFSDPVHGWESCWENYLPRQRAEFYTRVFSGLMETGLDGLIDFNCVSTQEKGFCPRHDEMCSLESWRENLIKEMI